jgi:hypothetical protein
VSHIKHGGGGKGGGGSTTTDTAALDEQKRQFDARMQMLEAQQTNQQGLLSQQLDAQKAQQQAAIDAQGAQSRIAEQSARDQKLRDEANANNATQSVVAQSAQAKMLGRLNEKQANLSQLQAIKSQGTAMDSGQNVLSMLAKTRSKARGLA